MVLSRSQLLPGKFPQEKATVVMTELEAILSSESFSSSKRCRDFLDFVVKHALEGDSESLTERFLGVELFGRAVDYETATDSIVRVRANDVRRRLAQYYSSQRSQSPVKIDLIAGGYIPEFHWREELNPIPQEEGATFATPVPAPNAPIEQTLPPATEATSGKSARARRNARVRFWSFATVIVSAVSLALFLHPRPSNFDLFWQPILDASSSPVLSLPGSDTFQLEPGATQQFSQSKPGESLTLHLNEVQTFHNWHVSMPVLQATLSVALALERKGKTPLVRMGNDLRTDELHGHPVIAIGSFSNPWTEQNVAGLRFTFDRGASDTDPPRITDTQNPKRSWTLPHTYPEPQSKDYAIITRTFDPVTREPFLSLAGLHSFGNQIAGEFVSQESSWDKIASRAPAGWQKMNLQIVLETHLIGTTPSSPKIVDVYFWK